MARSAREQGEQHTDEHVEQGFWRRRVALLNRWPLRVLGIVGTAALTGMVALLVPSIWDAAHDRVVDPIEVEAVTSNALRIERQIDDTPSFVIPRALQQIPPPPADGRPVQERYEWAARLGGVDALHTTARLVVKGTSSSPVLLEGLRVVVVRRDLGLEGTHVTYPGGGFVDERSAYVNLDRPRPRLELSSAADGGPWSFPLRVSKDELEVIDITAATEVGDCRWVAELTYLAAGRRQTLRVDNDGQPFRTTGFNRAVSYASIDGKSFYRDPQPSELTDGKE